MLQPKALVKPSPFICPLRPSRCKWTLLFLRHVRFVRVGAYYVTPMHQVDFPAPKNEKGTRPPRLKSTLPIPGFFAYADWLISASFPATHEQLSGDRYPRRKLSEYRVHLSTQILRILEYNDTIGYQHN